jgi:hypothetical protein
MSYSLNIPHRVVDCPILMKVTAAYCLARARDVCPLQEDKTAVTEVGCTLNFTVEGGLRRTLVQYLIDCPMLRSRVAAPEIP